MREQLVLLAPADRPDREWRLDDNQRKVGRRGLEEARRALRRASSTRAA